MEPPIRDLPGIGFPRLAFRHDSRSATVATTPRPAATPANPHAVATVPTDRSPADRPTDRPTDQPSNHRFRSRSHALVDPSAVRPLQPALDRDRRRQRALHLDAGHAQLHRRLWLRWPDLRRQPQRRAGVRLAGLRVLHRDRRAGRRGLYLRALRRRDRSARRRRSRRHPRRRRADLRLWRDRRRGPAATLGEDAPLSILDGRIEQQLRRSIMMVVGGGTAEVQRNLIATRGLGLPR